MNNVSDVSFSGELNGDNFSISVSGAGDMNADDYDDIIIGSPGNSAKGTYAGKSYVYFGGAFINNSPDLIMTGKVETASYGFSVSSAGDVNGDGLSDVICGALNDNTGGNQAGRVFRQFPQQKTYLSLISHRLSQTQSKTTPEQIFSELQPGHQM